jgi:hypothetical protein
MFYWSKYTNMMFYWSKYTTRMFYWSKYTKMMFYWSRYTNRMFYWSNLHNYYRRTINCLLIYISYEKLQKDGKVLCHLKFMSKVLPGPLTELSA